MSIFSRKKTVEPIVIRDIERISLQPGEILAVHLPEEAIGIANEQFRRVKEDLASQLPGNSNYSFQARNQTRSR